MTTNAELAASVKAWLILFDQAVAADASNAQHGKMLQLVERKNEEDIAAKEMDEGINQLAEKKRKTYWEQMDEDWEEVWAGHCKRWKKEKREKYRAEERAKSWNAGRQGDDILSNLWGPALTISRRHKNELGAMK